MDKLKKKLKEIDAKITAILASDDLSDDQRVEYKELEAEYERLTAQIVERAEMDAKAKARADAQAKMDADAKATERRITPAGVADRERPHMGSTATVANLAPVGLPERNRGYKTHREFLMNVMKVSMEGRNPGSVDPRLVPLMAVGSDEGRGSSDPTGGFLIPEAFSPDFMQLKPEDDPMGSLITKVPMALPIVKIPARTDKNHSSSVSGGLTVTRRPETVAGTASQMTMERVTMHADELFGLTYATEELLTDSPISFIALLEAGFSDQFTYQLINERLNGSGVGEFLGFANAANPCLITITKETGQAASTIVIENLFKMRARSWGYNKAIWMLNLDCLPQMGLLNQAVGTAGTGMIWMPSMRDGEPDRLLGRPVIFTEYMQSIGNAGDVGLFNWSQYLEGTYQPLQSAESIHVRFVNNERAFRFTMRNAGQPWWKTALTPKNGSNTLSPAVVLGAR